MKNEFYDKILDDLLEEAASNYVDSLEDEKCEEANLSEIHERKIKQMIKNSKNKVIRKKILHITKIACMIVISLLIVTAGLVTSVEAWRKEFVKMLMQNNDNNYMSIGFEQQYDGDEIEEETQSINSYRDEYIEFGYLPEGFEVGMDFGISQKWFLAYSIRNQKYYLYFYAMDIQQTEFQGDIEDTVFNYNDKKIFERNKSDRRTSYSWCDEDYYYSIVGNVSREEILRIIENIKILKKF